MRRGVLLLGAVPALVVGLACACGQGAECGEGERDDWGTCVPVECGEYPFGGFTRGDFVFVSVSSYAEDEDEDGTRADPYDTLAEGIAAAVQRGGGTTVVVASGTYPESILLDDRHDGLRIEGVCGPHVQLQGGELPTLMLDASSDTTVEVASVQISNALAPGIVVTGGNLALSNLGVHDTLGVGIAAFGSEAFLQLTDAVVTGTVGQEDYEDGYGLAIAEGATATIVGLEVRSSARAAVLIDGDGSSAVLTASMAVGNAIGEIGTSPSGIVVSNGANATLADLRIVDAWGVGLEVSGASRVTADRLTVFGTHAANIDGDLFGNGIVVLGGSTFDAVDLSVLGAAVYGLAAGGEGTVVDLQGGAIELSSPTEEEPTAGIGVVASEGARVVASDLRLDQNQVYGAVVSDPGSELVLTDVDVLDTRQTERSVGGGILVQEGGALDALRVSIVGSGTIGMLVDAASATITDLDVRDTRRGSFQSTAVGVAVQAGATFGAEQLTVTDTEGPGLLVSRSEATCSVCTLSRNTFAGVVAADGAQVVLSGALVDGTTPDATEGGGVGVFAESAESPVELTVSGSEIRGNSHAAVYVNEDGTVRIDTNTLVGGEATRNVWPRGTALYAARTTAPGLTVVGNRISASDGAGLFFDDGTATLADNRYPGNTIDVVQQLCGPGTPAPVGLDDEPVDVVELCPAFDYPVEQFRFLTVYEPLVLAE